MYFYRSFSEIAYICLGRVSVFLINILIAICITGVITLYMSKFEFSCCNYMFSFSSILNHSNFNIWFTSLRPVEHSVYNIERKAILYWVSIYSYVTPYFEKKD